MHKQCEHIFVRIVDGIKYRDGEFVVVKDWEKLQEERREDIKRMGIRWFQGWDERLFEEEQRMEQPHIEIIRENKII